MAHETKLIHYAVCEVKQILTNMRSAIKEQHSKVPTGLTLHHITSLSDKARRQHMLLQLAMYF